MTRLNAYLIEGYNSGKEKPRSIPIDMDDAKALIRKNCTNAIRSSELYRGLNAGDNSLFIEPAKHTRVSEFTDNYYMLLFQLMESWKKYPNLSKSLIGVSTSYAAAKWGSGVFQVFPYDGYDIGVAPYEHFWGSFKGLLNIGSGMDELNGIIDRIIRSHVSKEQTDPAKLKASFDNVDKIHHDSFEEIGPFVFFENGEKILDTFNKVLDPVKHGFELINTSKVWRLPQMPSKQIWTEAPCVLINMKYTVGSPTLAYKDRKSFLAELMNDLHSTA
jgi:hypothetical protein